MNRNEDKMESMDNICPICCAELTEACFHGDEDDGYGHLKRYWTCQFCQNEGAAVYDQQDGNAFVEHEVLEVKEPEADKGDGICPTCGAEVEFIGLHEIEDCYTKAPWECPRCGAQGTQWHDIVFAYCKDLTWEDGTPFTKEELENEDLGPGEGCCPVCAGDLVYHGDQKIVGNTTEVTWHCEECGVRGTEVNKLVFSEHLDYNAVDETGLTAIQELAYERYKLDWMLRQGHTLSEVVRGMAEYAADMDEDDDTSIEELFALWEEEVGFGGELYVCLDEFLGAEYLDEKYMRSLLTDKEYQTYLKDIHKI